MPVSVSTRLAIANLVLPGGDSQKSMTLNKSGRTLKITTAMLIQGSCGISRPLGDAGKLREYLARGQLTQLQRRLEADAKAIFALYKVPAAVIEEHTKPTTYNRVIFKEVS